MNESVNENDHTISRAETAADAARSARGTALADLLIESRKDTLATLGCWQAARPGLQVPQHAELNPPLWELGHIGWFAQRWIGRNPQRALGVAADPQARRTPARPADADALYDSSHVPHGLRWGLPLPDLDATLAHLQAQLDETLDLLARYSGEDSYFFRLSLLHEDMHHEAALYMAQALGVPVPDARWQPPRLPEPPPPIELPGGAIALGRTPDDRFAFDNEVGRCDLHLHPFQIDAQVLRWAEFLPFVEEGGYSRADCWDAEGLAWRAATRALAPRYLKRESVIEGWQQFRHGAWVPLDVAQPACHLTAHEARAWCRWAGRRLPTEAEWVCAAEAAPNALHWGAVWEWTASPFAPFEGFVAHPYRDYSAPWFDGRPVLKGASFMTQLRMRHTRYRNFFTAERNDIAAGFRTCALQA